MWNVRHFLISNENKSFYKKKNTHPDRLASFHCVYVRHWKIMMLWITTLINIDWFDPLKFQYVVIFTCVIYILTKYYTFLSTYPFGLKFHNCRNRKSLQTTTCLYMFLSRVRICPLIHLTMQSMHTCITCLVDKMKSNQQINTSTISLLFDYTQTSLNILFVKNAFFD